VSPVPLVPAVRQRRRGQATAEELGGSRRRVVVEAPGVLVPVFCGRSLQWCPVLSDTAENLWKWGGGGTYSEMLNVAAGEYDQIVHVVHVPM